MSEPVFRGVTPDGRWVVQVTKDDLTTEDGTYTSTVTLDGKDVIEMLKTDDTDKLIRWTHRQMAEAMRRSA